MGALATAVHSGKALYVGLSNYDGPTLEKATAILDELHVPFIINQNRYNIFDRTVEQQRAEGDRCTVLDKGLITFSPLAQGLLTNRYLNGVPADSRIAHDGRFLQQSALTPERLQQIRDLNDLAAERGQTLAEMSLAWLLHDGMVASVLVGASRPQQLIDNIGALRNTSFSDEELRRIDGIFAVDGPPSRGSRARGNRAPDGTATNEPGAYDIDRTRPAHGLCGRGSQAHSCG